MFPLIIAEKGDFLNHRMRRSINAMRVLGIDPGLATVGLGLINAETRDTPKVVEWLTIETPAHTPLEVRLCTIAEDFERYLEETKPDLAVVEKLFFAKNETTAMDVAHARGVLLSCIAARDIPLLCPSPPEMKSGITGDGRADKRQIQTMLLHTLKLRAIPTPDDAADALALALFGVLHGMPHALPSSINPDAMRKISKGWA